MFKKFVLSAIAIVSLWASQASAANVGFVPSTGIWFSRTEFSPKETVRIYTVIINNDYAGLEGVVEFYDNAVLLGNVEVKSLTRDTAKQIWVFWQPGEGKHSVSARFAKAVAIKENGERVTLQIQEINGSAGVPLVVGKSVVRTSESADGNGPSGVLGSVEVAVRREGDHLVIAAPLVAQVAGERIATGTPTSSTSSLGQAVQGVQDVFAKNRAILSKAEEVAGSITTTAGKVHSVYEKTKMYIAQGEALYAAGKEKLVWLEPAAEKTKAVWLKATNNNEPKRVLIVLGIIIIILYLIKRRWQQGLDQQF